MKIQPINLKNVAHILPLLKDSDHFLKNPHAGSSLARDGRIYASIGSPGVKNVYAMSIGI